MSDDAGSDENRDTSLRRTIEEAFEGRAFAALSAGPKWYCDNCSAEQTYGTRATHYLADTILNRGRIGDAVSDDGLKVLATYCEDCSLGRVIWPHRGSNEFILENRLSEDRHHEDVHVVDISRAPSGEAFDARASWEEISGVPFDMWSETVAQNEGSAEVALRGSENMVTTFLVLGIEPTELFQIDGSLDAGGIERARELFEEARFARGSDGLDPEAFSERVRERVQDRQDRSPTGG